ncbi:dsDNA nuclease domain-containing protein, partial [Streptococcus suis]
QETSDNGGIVAMTGFYYQMMVSVFYLGEVFQGKWDGMYLDHHQDIVLFNNSERIVKFIQVKTKNRSYSPADTKIVKSWIPKLFITAYTIEKLSGFNLRFEIVSNCCYQDTKS